jgi:hypothetical protein
MAMTLLARESLSCFSEIYRQKLVDVWLRAQALVGAVVMMIRGVSTTPGVGWTDGLFSHLTTHR